MTEIKSAIHCMRTSQDIEVCEECPIYGNVGSDHCFVDSCGIAEKSLNAWEEVLTELEKQKDVYKLVPISSTAMGKAYTYDESTICMAIEIIKQKLEGVKE